MANNPQAKFSGRKSWMSQQREKFGTEFLNTIRLDSLNNNIERILEDIAEGRVEKDKDFSPLGFFHPTFVNSMRKFCDARCIYFGQIYSAFQQALAATPQLQGESMYVMRINLYAAQYTFYYEMTQLWMSVEQLITMKAYDETVLHTIQTKAAAFAQQNPISMNRLFTPRDSM